MKEDVLVASTDSSDIKVANREEWVRKKWHARGFIKKHIVDKKSKEIVAMRVIRACT